MVGSYALLVCITFTFQASAQLLAGQPVNVSTYNNELYYESAGSYQRILYEEGINSTTTTKLMWSEVYVAPCGEITADVRIFGPLIVAQHLLTCKDLAANAA